MILLRGSVIAAALLLLFAIPAGAAQRYAAPGGTGTTCGKEARCSIEEAVDKAGNGDEVIVGSGSYSVTSSLLPALGVKNVSVHGEAGGAPPRIRGSFNDRVLQLRQGGDISYLEVISESLESTAVGCAEGGSVERVTASVVGAYSIGIYAGGDCAVRSSVALASGTNDYALFSKGGTEAGVVSNVTAISEGEETLGIGSAYGGASAGGHPLIVSDSIASGSYADLSTLFSPEGPGQILVSHSDFDQIAAGSESRVTDLGGNLTTPPLFVEASGGNYREAAGSPTIDAGVTVPAQGSFDLAGNARVLGAAPDIGAYEFIPPGTTEGGGVRSISIKPKRFSKKAKVTYTMSGPATVEFSVSKRIGHGKRYKPVKGSFSQEGKAGVNTFVFKGRIGGRKLKPGHYKLTAYAGHLVSAAFEIAAPRKHHHRRG